MTDQQQTDELLSRIAQSFPRERNDQHAPEPLAPITRKRPPVVCQKCKGAGYLRADVNYGHPNFGKPILCTCKLAELEERRRAALHEQSDLGVYQKFVFSSFDPSVPGVGEAYAAARQFAQNSNGWLLLVGPNGCGKTHLALAIANERARVGDAVLFAVVPDLLDYLRATFAPSATEVYGQRFSRMRDAGVLFLDDFGSQQSSQWAKEKLFQLLNHRYNLELPTVITANPKGLREIDERVQSRLSDLSLVQRIVMTKVKDYRRHKPLQRKEVMSDGPLGEPSLPDGKRAKGARQEGNRGSMGLKTDATQEDAATRERSGGEGL